MTQAADSITGTDPPLAASPQQRLANSESASILQRQSPFHNRQARLRLGATCRWNRSRNRYPQAQAQTTRALPRRMAIASQQRRSFGAAPTAISPSSGRRCPSRGLEDSAAVVPRARSEARRALDCSRIAPLWLIRPSPTVRRPFCHSFRGLAGIAGAPQSGPETHCTIKRTALQCSGIEREDTGASHATATYLWSSSNSCGPNR
jgi:hypothetical protein